MTYQTYKSGSAAGRGVGGLGSTLLVAFSHVYSPPSLLEITEPEIKLRRERSQWKSRQAGFLLPAKVLMVRLLYCLLGSHDIHRCASLMFCPLQLPHDGKLHLSPSGYCLQLLTIPRKAARWAAFHTWPVLGQWGL